MYILENYRVVKCETAVQACKADDGKIYETFREAQEAGKQLIAQKIRYYTIVLSNLLEQEEE